MTTAWQFSVYNLHTPYTFGSLFSRYGYCYYKYFLMVIIFHKILGQQIFPFIPCSRTDQMSNSYKMSKNFLSCEHLWGLGNGLQLGTTSDNVSLLKVLYVRSKMREVFRIINLLGWPHVNEKIKKHNSVNCFEIKRLLISKLIGNLIQKLSRFFRCPLTINDKGT